MRTFKHSAISLHCPVLAHRDIELLSGNARSDQMPCNRELWVGVHICSPTLEWFGRADHHPYRYKRNKLGGTDRFCRVILKRCLLTPISFSQLCSQSSCQLCNQSNGRNYGQPYAKQKRRLWGHRRRDRAGYNRLVRRLVRKSDPERGYGSSHHDGTTCDCRAINN